MGKKLMKRVKVVFMFFLALIFWATTISLAQAGEPQILIGADVSGVIHHQPADWPSKAGTWNGKGARYCALNNKLVFETFREDIIGGSLNASEPHAPGVTTMFVAGPETGKEERSGTTILYVAERDGSKAYPLGAMDVVDGQNGVEIYESTPETSLEAVAPIRQKGAILFANQNKDLGAWHPNGKWIFMGVEMKRHGLKHQLGCSEIGMFNNLWAVSIDGKIWVQLTHFEKTWAFYDPFTMFPYGALDRMNAWMSTIYSTSGNNVPFGAYSASAKGTPPPASGTMRPNVGNIEKNGRVPIVWAERVGLHGKYPWGGVLNLAMADITFVAGLPVLVNYRRMLTPSPAKPDGLGQWANPGGNTVIGSGYEPSAFSSDDSEILFASDVFIPALNPSRKTEMWMQIYPDTIAWKWNDPSGARIENLTAYGPTYAYQPNAANGFGHWEEIAVFAKVKGVEYVAFCSSANLSPAFDPTHFKKTFSLDTWIVPRDKSAPAKKIASLSDSEHRRWTYPTAFDEKTQSLLLTVVFGDRVGAGSNPPGAIYTLPLP